MAQAFLRGNSLEQDARASAPLITLFERDDAIAVPLLSQLRMAGYDVRSSRTPVELFDILSKHLVTLVLVDLGAATAGRREFWVALDAQRRGRAAMQVLTFRYMAPASDLDLDFEPSARAIADVEIHGAHEFARIIEAVRQRAPLHGSAPSAAVSYTADGAIQPLGAALGLNPPPFSAYGGFSQGSDPGYAQPYGMPQQGYNGAAFGIAPVPSNAQAPGINGFSPLGFPSMPSQAPGAFEAHLETTPFAFGSQPNGQPFPGPFAPQASPFAQPGASNPFAQPSASNPYAQPGASNPFAQPAVSNPYGGASDTSPFAQPYGANPFFQEPAAPASPFAAGVGQSSNPFNAPTVSRPPVSMPSFASDPSSHWGSGGFNEPPGVPVWRTPDSGGSFSSDPGVQNFFNAGRLSTPSHDSHPKHQAPVFQDAWTPPDGDPMTETSALSEAMFQHAQMPQPFGPSGDSADAWNAALSEPRRPSAPQYGALEARPWDAPNIDAHGSKAEFIHYEGFDQSEPGQIEGPTAAIPTPPAAPLKVTEPAKRHKPSTATETALSSVLIEGSLLSPTKLETLRGIQDMLSDAEQPRKLGELALMFKFLSADQLLAAMLVSRGLVSPQQIAALGKVKQDLASRGDNIDLEALLVRHNILSADQLRSIRQELAS